MPPTHRRRRRPGVVRPRAGDHLASSPRIFGPYPFRHAGGIVDDVRGPRLRAGEPDPPDLLARSSSATRSAGDSVVVHELAHQWYGDSLAVGPVAATSGSTRASRPTPSGCGASTRARHAAGDLRLRLRAISRRRPVLDADDRRSRARPPVRRAGLRPRRDDPARAAAARSATTRSSGILRSWASTNAGGNVTTAEFIALAERISGQDLDAFFTTWLFTPGKPDAGRRQRRRSRVPR